MAAAATWPLTGPTKLIIQKEATPMNIAYGTLLVAASSDVKELFPWFAVMFGILFVAIVVMLVKTRSR